VLEGIGLHFKGYCLMMLGDPAGAEAAFRGEMAIGARLRLPAAIGHGLSAIGQLFHSLGRGAEALAAFRKALESFVPVADSWGIAKSLEGVAGCLAETNPDRAARLLGAAEAFRERIAHPLWEPDKQFLAPALESLGRSLGAGFEATWRAGRSLGRDAAVGLALAEAEPGADPSPTPAAGSTRPAPAQPDLRVEALGPLTVTRRGEPVDPGVWGGARSRELLLFFLTHREGVTKDQVGAAFWPAASPAQLRSAFHVAIHRLRKALGQADWIEAADDRYRLDRRLAVELDAELFEREVPAAIAALARGGEGAAARLGAALGRYRGPFLDGEPVGDWALEVRDRIEHLFVGGGLALARWLLEQGRQAEADELLQRVQSRDGLNEAAWRLRMVSLARRGERPQALRLYQQLSALLERELGSDPDPETDELHDRIKQGASV
jgi:DNA-binding SARP family transcriptional activator